MTDYEVAHYLSKGMLLVLLLSLPAIVVAVVVGVLVSLLQALTQIQEQTLPFAIKLVAVGITLFMTLRWIGTELYLYTMNLFDLIGKIH
jgi:type III secretion protein S